MIPVRVREDDVHVVLDLDDGLEAHLLGAAPTRVSMTVVLVGVCSPRSSARSSRMISGRRAKAEAYVEQLLVALGQRDASGEWGTIGEPEEGGPPSIVPVLHLAVGPVRRGEEPARRGRAARPPRPVSVSQTLRVREDLDEVEAPGPCRAARAGHTGPMPPMSRPLKRTRAQSRWGGGLR